MARERTITDPTCLSQTGLVGMGSGRKPVCMRWRVTTHGQLQSHRYVMKKQRTAPLSPAAPSGVAKAKTNLQPDPIPHHGVCGPRCGTSHNANFDVDQNALVSIPDQPKPNPTHPVQPQTGRPSLDNLVTTCDAHVMDTKAMGLPWPKPLQALQLGAKCACKTVVKRLLGQLR